MNSLEFNQLVGKYLTVALNGESYGIAVLKVREIIRPQKITPVPQAPAHVCGVINLRGRVIPVVDLRLKFGLPAKFTELTCIVVVQVKPADRPALSMGLVVDSVEDVVNFTPADLAPVPEFGTRVDTSYLLGMARAKDQVKMLLDIDRVVAAETVNSLALAS